MSLFTSRKHRDEAQQARLPGALVDRVHPLSSTPPVMTAGEATRVAFPIAHRLAGGPRLFLVMSGAEVDLTGRAGEWQFHFVYPDDHLESIVTVMAADRSPIPGTPVVREQITPWPPPGSTQEAMARHQGPTARLIMEEQWADRLERLPGLPQAFIDSSDAIAAVLSLGVDLKSGVGATKMKGRTPPGRAPVWEIVEAQATYHTPFA